MTGPRSNNQPKLHVYAQQGAMTVEWTFTQTVDGVHPTINLDLTRGQKPDYDWSEKITLQLSVRELPLLAGVTLGLLPKVHFKRPDKGIVIQRQDNKLYCHASAADGRKAALPISIGDTQRLSEFALAVLLRGSLSGDAQMVLAALKGSCALYTEESVERRAR